jgi:hypothetical protein
MRIQPPRATLELVFAPAERVVYSLVHLLFAPQLPKIATPFLPGWQSSVARFRSYRSENLFGWRSWL